MLPAHSPPELPSSVSTTGRSLGLVSVGEGLCVGGLCTDSQRTTGSSVSSTSVGLPPNSNATSTDTSLSPQSKSATLESNASSIATIKSQHSTPKKHSVILRPFLRKKTKRSTSRSEQSSGGVGANAGKEGAGEEYVMKRSASPTLPEGATQAKSEAPPATSNGQPPNNQQHNNSDSAISIIRQ
ncbi:unnamed protein product [Toxocara canis]|uniref:Cytospin-A n=1 Tax=Toxocara canis TaxID=6265 RepID=A0A183VG99_TOXCA|nr:unnamed protein product [Toxocara canis]